MDFLATKSEYYFLKVNGGFVATFPNKKGQNTNTLVKKKCHKFLNFLTVKHLGVLR